MSDEIETLKQLLAETKHKLELEVLTCATEVDKRIAIERQLADERKENESLMREVQRRKDQPLGKLADDLIRKTQLLADVTKERDTLKEDLVTVRNESWRRRQIIYADDGDRRGLEKQLAEANAQAAAMRKLSMMLWKEMRTANGLKTEFTEEAFDKEFGTAGRAMLDALEAGVEELLDKTFHQHAVSCEHITSYQKKPCNCDAASKNARLENALIKMEAALGKKWTPRE